jgi:hypothetical protein
MRRPGVPPYWLPTMRLSIRRIAAELMIDLNDTALVLAVEE